MVDRIVTFFLFGATALIGLGNLILIFLDNTQLDRHTRQDYSERVINLSQRPLLCNKHKRRTFMPSAEFEPASPAIEQLQT
jgi:hypothetical protein